MIYDKFDALMSLRPNGAYTWTGSDYSGLVGDNKPTEDEINTELARLETEYKNNQYQRDRAAEYPSVVDQLDEIYHHGIDGWKAKIAAIKAKYPKP